MSEFRDGLDAEARRVRAEPDALERMRGRAHRRRVRRQVGSGVAALAVAGAGFAVVFGAFRGPVPSVPQAGPSSSISPTGMVTTVRVVAPAHLEEEASALAAQLLEAGFDANVIVVAEAQGSPFTMLQYAQDAGALAKRIRSEFLTADVEAIAYAGTEPTIQITLGADYQKQVRGTVRVRVLDAGAGRAGTDTAAAQLRGAGYDVVEVGDAPATYDETIVACAPQHDEEGFRILEDFFPHADFRGELPSDEHDVTVYVGPDFLPRGGAGD
jgi:hypothetical protein